jgi:hypothetical protein
MDSVDTKFEVWKTVELGRYPNSPAVIDALNVHSVNTHAYSLETALETALEETDFSLERRSLDLVLVSVPELGIDASVGTAGASTLDVIAAAAKFGLEPCPAEVGPLLRLEYLHQPLKSRIFICMRPLLISRGMYQIRCDEDGVLHLGLYFSYNNREWIHKRRFVFVRKK